MLTSTISTALIAAAAALITGGESNEANEFVIGCFMVQSVACAFRLADKDLWALVKKTQHKLAQRNIESAKPVTHHLPLKSLPSAKIQLVLNRDINPTSDDGCAIAVDTGTWPDST
jgi:hypothetical protein